MEQQQSRGDTVKLAVSVAVLLAGAVAYYYFAEQSTLVRVIGLLAAVGVAVAVASRTALGRQLLGFSLEVRTEVRKVVWPTRTETMQTTLIVVATVLVVAILLWLIDAFLLWGVKSLTGEGG